jgi:large subunit ribosomal protein L25
MSSNHVTLQAKKRESGGRGAARRLRSQGVVPAIIYGADQDNYSIQVSAREFGTILRSSSGDNFLVDLQIEGAKEKTKLAMVQDIQQDPLSGQLVHVDFHAVNENQTLTATVTIELIGESEGVKQGGVLDHQLHSIDVHCRPADLPEKLEVDISGMVVGDSLHVSDIGVPDGVELTLDDEVVVVQVAEPRLAAAGEEDGEAAEGEEPEVVGEKADGDGDGGGEEAASE